jgi:hypothetical protein
MQRPLTPGAGITGALNSLAAARVLTCCWQPCGLKAPNTMGAEQTCECGGSPIIANLRRRAGCRPYASSGRRNCRSMT